MITILYINIGMIYYLSKSETGKLSLFFFSKISCLTYVIQLVNTIYISYGYVKICLMNVVHIYETIICITKEWVNPCNEKLITWQDTIDLDSYMSNFFRSIKVILWRCWKFESFFFVAYPFVCSMLYFVLNRTFPWLLLHSFIVSLLVSVELHFYFSIRKQL